MKRYQRVTQVPGFKLYKEMFTAVRNKNNTFNLVWVDDQTGQPDDNKQFTLAEFEKFLQQKNMKPEKPLASVAQDLFKKMEDAGKLADLMGETRHNEYVNDPQAFWKDYKILSKITNTFVDESMPDAQTLSTAGFQKILAQNENQAKAAAPAPAEDQAPASQGKKQFDQKSGTGKYYSQA